MIARFAVFLIALVGWSVYFYGIDWLIMQGQGLPVAWNLLPV